MNEIVLKNIAFEPDVTLLMDKLRVRKGRSDAGEFSQLVEEAQRIAKPKAFYKVSPIEAKGDDYVIVEGVKLSSRVLRDNLEQTNRVFPFVVTCGMELEDWSTSIEDILHRFWADAIAETALWSANEAMNKNILDRYRPGSVSRMNPGSLEDWPITEQRPLFTILGNPEETIGVQLMDSLLMRPTKSLSGVIFPLEESFESY